MTSALLNLLAPANITDPGAAQASSAIQGQSANAAGGANGKNVSDGEGFADFLNTARQQLSHHNKGQQTNANAPGVAVAALTSADLSALNAALTSLSEEQIIDLQQVIGDALGADIFSGDEGAEQAFSELKEQLEQLDLDEIAGDDVDVEGLIEQLPIVSQLPESSRNDLLSKMRQFIQYSLINRSANTGGEQSAQAAQTSGFRTEPLLEAVQASVFRDEQTVQTQVAQNTAQAAQAAIEKSQTADTLNDNVDDLPRWLRDISEIRQVDANVQQASNNSANAQAAVAFSTADLPDVDLPVAAATASQFRGELNGARPEVTLNSAQAVVQEATRSEILQPTREAVNALHSDSDPSFSNIQNVTEQAKGRFVNVNADPQPTQTNADARAGTNQNAALNFTDIVAEKNTETQASREVLLPLPNNSDALRSLTSLQVSAANVGGADASVAPTPQQITQAATYNAQAKTDPNLYQYRTEVLDQVEVAITRARTTKSDRITVQLSPAELGRVDVSVDIKSDGSAQLHVSAERRETLDMLQRDARGLERALQEAGLEADAGNMEFTLKQDGSQHASADSERDGGGQHGAQAGDGAKNTDAADASDQEIIGQTEIITTTAHVVQNGLDVVV